jgi:hypothetical protein
VTAALGYDPLDLVTLRVADLAAPDLQESTPGQWEQFLADGRQDGKFTLRGKDGRLVEFRFQARAHHPIPGFHVSRLWPDPDFGRSTPEAE